MTGRAGPYYVVGYGGAVGIRAIDALFGELNVLGNQVGTCNDPVEPMAPSAQGSVRLQTPTYPLDAVNDAIADLGGGRPPGRAILVPG